MKNNAKILIVEDEAITAIAMRDEIRKMGYKYIDIAISYHKAIDNIINNKPDLILLDINLKSEYTGIDIANRDEVLNKIPIIYITAHIDTQTLKEIIATNPNSYLSKKPLKYEELEVAISLALKSKKGIVDLDYGFTYDLEYRNLFKAERPIRLSRNEKILLEQLIQKKGEIVPLGILEFEIWGNEVKSESSLRTLVRNLRKKLNPKMVINIPSFGYSLAIKR
jgi:DNA-binding response OmpR family regulator